MPAASVDVEIVGSLSARTGVPEGPVVYEKKA